MPRVTLGWVKGGFGRFLHVLDGIDFGQENAHGPGLQRAVDVGLVGRLRDPDERRDADRIRRAG